MKNWCTWRFFSGLCFSFARPMAKRPPRGSWPTSRKSPTTITILFSCQRVYRRKNLGLCVSFLLRRGPDSRGVRDVDLPGFTGFFRAILQWTRPGNRGGLIALRDDFLLRSAPIDRFAFDRNPIACGGGGGPWFSRLAPRRLSVPPRSLRIEIPEKSPLNPRYTHKYPQKEPLQPGNTQ